MLRENSALETDSGIRNLVMPFAEQMMEHAARHMESYRKRPDKIEPIPDYRTTTNLAMLAVLEEDIRQVLLELWQRMRPEMLPGPEDVEEGLLEAVAAAAVTAACIKARLVLLREQHTRRRQLDALQ